MKDVMEDNTRPLPQDANYLIELHKGLYHSIHYDWSRRQTANAMGTQRRQRSLPAWKIGNDLLEEGIGMWWEVELGGGFENWWVWGRQR